MVEPKVCWVVVLGDFGRSPRMQYHTLSLCQQSGYQVHVVSYAGSRPIQPLVDATNVTMHSISKPSAALTRLPRIMGLVFKAIQQLFALLWLMFLSLPRPSFVLVQTPPAIPTLAVCWAASLWHRCVLIVDWHNFAYTLMELSMGKKHLLVKLAKWFERFWARSGTYNLCVTKSMQEELARNWGVTAVVLYDRPPEHFKQTPLEIQHELFHRLAPTLLSEGYQDFLSRSLASETTLTGTSEATIVTQIGNDGTPMLRSSRPGIVISSTSWTPDEDFGILLEAAQLYDTKAKASTQLPEIVFFITGKGPLRDFYNEKLRSLRLSKVAFRLVWLEPQDYPSLLGSADLGVCLHTSSSGLDLPMKVVDMYGSQLPVCAVYYQCISELVEDGVTGLLFHSAEQLASQFVELFMGFPARSTNQLSQLRANVKDKQSVRWQQNWDSVVSPLLQSASHQPGNL